METVRKRQTYRPPSFRDFQCVATLLCELYPFQSIEVASMTELNSYEDRNYYFRGTLALSTRSKVEGVVPTGEYVLKLSREKPALVSGRAGVMKHLAANGIPCSVPMDSRCGVQMESITARVENKCLVDLRGKEACSSNNLETEEFLVQLLTFIPGCLLEYVEDPSPILLHQVGELVGRMDLLLEEFSQPALEDYTSIWDLRNFLQVKKFLHFVKHEEQIAMVQAVLTLFKTTVMPTLPKLKRGIIHADIRGMNVVVNPKICQVVGLIDFGDCKCSCYLFELATSVAELMTLDMQNPLHFVTPFICGYLSKFPLVRNELDCLYASFLARLCLSVVMSAYTVSTSTKDEYVLVSEDKKWKLIELLLELPKEKVENIIMV